MRTFVVAALLLAACSSKSAPPQTYVEVRGTKALAIFTVEVADTPAERERGLMGRTEIKPGTGMLFVYPSAGLWGGYWMKDTLVPLDVAFVKDGFVVYTATMEPCESDPCPRTDPKKEYDSVLEVRAGTFSIEGIGIGAEVTRRN
jgi:uncharacterized protein